jgi:hypothetical protein
MRIENNDSRKIKINYGIILEKTLNIKETVKIKTCDQLYGRMPPSRCLLKKVVFPTNPFIMYYCI